MIRSRYSPSFYIFSMVLLGIIALVIDAVVHAWAPILPLAVPPAIILFIMWRRFFFLRISPDSVFIYTHFKRRTIPVSGIRSILLWGRKKLIYGHIDALTIITADGRPIQLPDGFCANMPEIRRHVLARFTGQVRDAPVIVSRPAISEGATEPLYGNIFFTVNAFPIYLFVLIAGVANFWGNPPLSGRLLPLLFLFFFWMLSGIHSYYFRLNSDTLEVRNQFFPWIHRSWPLDDIDNVLFESIEGGKGSTNILRIRTVDLRSKGYRANGLGNRHWLALGIALQKRGIRVKNELTDVHLQDGPPEPRSNAGLR